MRIRRPRFVIRSLSAAVAVLLFASLNHLSLDSHFWRVYGSSNSVIHIYQYCDCFMIADRPADHDAVMDNAAEFVVLRTWGGPPQDESYVWSHFVAELIRELDDAASARSSNDARPPWYGVRLVPWKGSQAILVEPGKLRWFALALIAPLGLGLIRARARRMRQRRGACMLCGYSLFGCPSPRCPECGDSVVPFAAAAATNHVETGAS